MMVQHIAHRINSSTYITLAHTHIHIHTHTHRIMSRLESVVLPPGLALLLDTVPALSLPRVGEIVVCRKLRKHGRLTYLTLNGYPGCIGYLQHHGSHVLSASWSCRVLRIDARSGVGALVTLAGASFDMSHSRTSNPVRARLQARLASRRAGDAGEPATRE